MDANNRRRAKIDAEGFCESDVIVNSFEWVFQRQSAHVFRMGHQHDKSFDILMPALRLVADVIALELFPLGCAAKHSRIISLRRPESARQMPLAIGVQPDAGILHVHHFVVGPEGVLDTVDTGEEVERTELEVALHAIGQSDGDAWPAFHEPPVFVEVVIVQFHVAIGGQAIHVKRREIHRTQQRRQRLAGFFTLAGMDNAKSGSVMVSAGGKVLLRKSGQKSTKQTKQYDG